MHHPLTHTYSFILTLSLDLPTKKISEQNRGFYSLNAVSYENTAVLLKRLQLTAVFLTSFTKNRGFINANCGILYRD